MKYSGRLGSDRSEVSFSPHGVPGLVKTSVREQWTSVDVSESNTKLNKCVGDCEHSEIDDSSHLIHCPIGTVDIVSTGASGECSWRTTRISHALRHNNTKCRICNQEAGVSKGEGEEAEL